MAQPELCGTSFGAGNGQPGGAAGGGGRAARGDPVVRLTEVNIAVYVGLHGLQGFRWVYMLLGLYGL